MHVLQNNQLKNLINNWRKKDKIKCIFYINKFTKKDKHNNRDKRINGKLDNRNKNKSKNKNIRIKNITMTKMTKI